MKVKKAIIPAAGLGTRILPVSKSVPKEMINIVDKPAIQYIVEEAVASGIEEILIITNRGKGAIEDHFDHAFELEHCLKSSCGKERLYEDVLCVANLANIYFLRQKQTKGLGHAVLCARSFVGDEPFVVMYGDDVIISDDPVTAQLIRVYDEFGKSTAGVQEVSHQDILKYSSLRVEPIRDNIMKCLDILEKPTPDKIMSNYAVLGRVLLTPDIFDLIQSSCPDPRDGEIYLTQALASLAKKDRLNAVDFVGKRYDIGNKLGILKANCEAALAHPEIKDSFKAYIKELAAGI
ncbi:MAG: UTP--glucose-1-phosphate uridylyltransferase [Oscillospiraceae bacterium]|jgi:UTP--glucose-1-phosphate uridylyltransferase|nr:UTP--glucose-1-phosphate uridylyltransferase [Oscillospiraceae bacterium]